MSDDQFWTELNKIKKENQSQLLNLEQPQPQPPTEDSLIDF